MESVEAREARYAEAIHKTWCTDDESEHGPDISDKVAARAVLAVADVERAEALREAADEMSARLDQFPRQGSHTRARWAEGFIRDRASQIADPQA